ncbi:hypothetical protein SH501x_004154 [Pirellulaceae bacterium SH501]
MILEPLDRIPLWLLFPLIFFGSLVMLEAGYRIGKWRHLRVRGEKESPVAAMSASVLGLLAFMLAFAFGMASGRFDDRRLTVLQEANSIGTTYLRAQLLPEPHKSEIEQRLIRYTELRAKKLTPDTIESAIKESLAIQNEIWTRAVAVAKADTDSITTGLFIESLNESIDLHSKRVFVGLYSRVPVMIWGALLLLVVLGVVSLGYHAGIAGTKRSLEMLILAFAFTIVLYLIFDLDRSHEGLLQISQRAMVDLYTSMQTTTAN